MLFDLISAYALLDGAPPPPPRVVVSQPVRAERRPVAVSVYDLEPIHGPIIAPTPPPTRPVRVVQPTEHRVFVPRMVRPLQVVRPRYRLWSPVRFSGFSSSSCPGGVCPR